MGALTDARTALADDLADRFPNHKVYAWIPPAPVVPCVIVSPDDAPLELLGYGRYGYRLKITAVASAQSATAKAMADLETDLETLAAWAGPTAADLEIGPARFGDATVYAVGLSILVPVNIPTT
jgi:hypothetical protein